MKTGKWKVRGMVFAAWLTLLGVQGLDGAMAQGGGAGIFQSYAKPLPLPDFSLEDLQGKLTHIKDFKGQVILLHFWATW